ncbi:hypothetical protein FACS189418_6050 [Clostridia bacterium]|nr:hypothetical protein FACS189418_6050 [Clostridia bacterium]
MNFIKYTKLDSGGKAELSEGNICKSIIPLVRVSEKQVNRTSEKNLVMITYFKQYDQVTVADFADSFKLSKEHVCAILFEMRKENLIEEVVSLRSVKQK